MSHTPTAPPPAASLKGRGQILLGILIACAVLLFDYMSKQFMLGLLAEPPHTMEILSFFNLALVWNRGISFGMLAAQNQPLLLTAGAGAILVVLLLWLWRADSRLTASSLGLIIGGAIGNILDRLVYGAVVDFL